MIPEVHLNTRFSEDNIPPFPCPSCGASLVPDGKEHLCTRESKDSANYYRETGEIEAQTGTFTLWLKCSHGNCQEPVCCIGEYGVHVDGPLDNQFLNSYLQPKFFLPTLQLFRPPVGLPDELAARLTDAFSLFWSNPAASGNALRVTLEHLMDHLRIKKLTKNQKGKFVPLKLHDRIVRLRQKPATVHIADKLLALKWLGNHGSHPSGLQREDLIHAFQLFEYTLEEIFQKRTHTLTKLATRINRRKGP